jgi:hypothetical protein
MTAYLATFSAGCALILIGPMVALAILPSGRYRIWYTPTRWVEIELGAPRDDDTRGGQAP